LCAARCSGGIGFPVLFVVQFIGGGRIGPTGSCFFGLRQALVGAKIYWEREGDRGCQNRKANNIVYCLKMDRPYREVILRLAIN